MNATIVFVLVLAGLLVVSGVLYFAVLSPAAQERIKLQRQARLDFQNARGNVHLKLLRAALDRHQQAHQSCQSALAEAKKRRDDARAGRDRDLQGALEAHILQTRLREIPGIGQTYAAQLQSYALRSGGLKSLRSASSHVIGIGEARQAAVDAWVAGCVAQLPALLAGDFPRKAEIEQQAAAEQAAISEEIAKLTVEEAAIADKLTRLRTEIKPLAQISPDALYRALRDPESMSEAIERYLRGAFAEWEPVPDWFKEIVAEGAD